MTEANEAPEFSQDDIIGFLTEIDIRISDAKEIKDEMKDMIESFAEALKVKPKAVRDMIKLHQKLMKDKEKTLTELQETDSLYEKLIRKLSPGG